jgi:hypothetical protein
MKQHYRKPGRCPACGSDRTTQGCVDWDMCGKNRILSITRYCLRSKCRVIFTDVYRFERKIRRTSYE